MNNPFPIGSTVCLKNSDGTPSEHIGKVYGYWYYCGHHYIVVIPNSIIKWGDAYIAGAVVVAPGELILAKAKEGVPPEIVSKYSCVKAEPYKPVTAAGGDWPSMDWKKFWEQASKNKMFTIKEDTNSLYLGTDSAGPDEDDEIF